jgi:hypothetical protein
LKRVNVNINDVNDNINGQSKGKEIKVNESKEQESTLQETVDIDSAFASIENHLNK